MSWTLSEITMDKIGTVRETAHALSMLSAVPDVVSSQLNAISERGSSLTDFKNMAKKVNIIRYETAVCATCETKPLVKSVRCHSDMGIPAFLVSLFAKP